VPPLSALPAFVAASLVLLAIPGPAVMFIVARSGAQGRRAGLVSVLGVHAASIVHVLGAVVGLSAVLVASATGFTVVKVVGGAYLVLLGLRSLRGVHQASITVEPAPRRPRRLFAEGFLVNLFNPKVALFFLAFLPQFVDPARGAAWAQILLLGLLFACLGAMTDGTWALVAGTFGEWLRGSKRYLRVQRYVSGSVFVALGAVAAFSAPVKKS
jgi:threonine/homoserine/homoserine lactone efflux protein